MKQLIKMLTMNMIFIKTAEKYQNFLKEDKREFPKQTQEWFRGTPLKELDVFPEWDQQFVLFLSFSTWETQGSVFHEPWMSRLLHWGWSQARLSIGLWVKGLWVAGLVLEICPTRHSLSEQWLWIKTHKEENIELSGAKPGSQISRRHTEYKREM